MVDSVFLLINLSGVCFYAPVPAKAGGIMLSGFLFISGHK